MRRLIFFLIGLLIVTVIVSLMGCKETPAKPAPPAHVVKVYVPTYAPIPKALTKRCHWPKGAPLLDVIEVAKARRICLERYDHQFDAIDSVEGNPVP